MTTASDILTMLAANANLIVHDGYPEVDEEEKVIALEMPYLVFNGSPGRDNDVRFGGRAGGRVYGFDIIGVAETREQAEAVLGAAYELLNRKRLGGRLIRRDEAHMKPRKDDDYNRPGGEPIFYGVDPYSVAI